MGRVRSDDPDRLVLRSGGGCLSVFGLPFLLAGLAVLTSPLWGPMKDSKTGEAAPLYFVIPFGLAFATVGAGLVLGRAGKILDRRRETVTTWWGLLVPLKTTVRPLSDFESVSLTEEVRRSKNSTYTVYPVRLVSPGGEDVKLEERRDLGKARALAEEATKLAGLKLVDRSLGGERVREAAELDESLRDRARRTGLRADVPEPPPEARSLHTVVGESLVFDIPPPGLGAGHVVALAAGLGIPIIVTVVFLLPILGEEGMPRGAKLLFAVFLGVFFIAVPLIAVWGGVFSSLRRRTRVDVSPGRLAVSTSGLVRTKVVSIPTDELEELEVVRAGRSRSRSFQDAFLHGRAAILARSDRAHVTFGAGLSRPELEWMKAVIETVVTA